jgi:hypothetical protein
MFHYYLICNLSSAELPSMCNPSMKRTENVLGQQMGYCPYEEALAVNTIDQFGRIHFEMPPIDRGHAVGHTTILVRMMNGLVRLLGHIITANSIGVYQVAISTDGDIKMYGVLVARRVPVNLYSSRREFLSTSPDKSNILAFVEVLNQVQGLINEGCNSILPSFTYFKPSRARFSNKMASASPKAIIDYMIREWTCREVHNTLEGLRYPIKTIGAKTNWMDEKEPILAKPGFRIEHRKINRVKGDGYCCQAERLNIPNGLRQYYGPTETLAEEEVMLHSRGRINIAGEVPLNPTAKSSMDITMAPPLKRPKVIDEPLPWSSIDDSSDEDEEAYQARVATPPVGGYDWREVELYGEELKSFSFPPWMRSRWSLDVEMPVSFSTRGLGSMAYISTPFITEDMRSLTPIIEYRRYLERDAPVAHNTTTIIKLNSNLTSNDGDSLLKAWEEGVDYIYEFEGKTDVSSLMGERGDQSSMDRIQFTLDEVTLKRLGNPYSLHLLFQEELDSYNGFSRYHQLVSQYCREFVDDKARQWFWCDNTRSYVVARTTKEFYSFGWVLQSKKGALEPVKPDISDMPNEVTLKSGSIQSVLKLPYCTKMESTPSRVHHPGRSQGSSRGGRTIIRSSGSSSSSSSTFNRQQQQYSSPQQPSSQQQPSPQPQQPLQQQPPQQPPRSPTLSPEPTKVPQPVAIVVDPTPEPAQVIDLETTQSDIIMTTSGDDNPPEPKKARTE